MYKHGKYTYTSISPPPEGPRKGLNEAFGLPPDQELRAVVESTRIGHRGDRHLAVVGWLGYAKSLETGRVGRVAVMRWPTGTCRAVFIAWGSYDHPASQFVSLSIPEFIAAQERMKDIRRAKLIALLEDDDD